ncbi:MAG: hypothetical protein K0R98_1365, partial [Rickettsiaceae bacterium]|nr:hypothetical protein [Rickettsiaceae bacterium]
MNAIFKKIKKEKYEHVSFYGTDLSKLSFKANDMKFGGRLFKDVSSNGALLTTLIAENETAKVFDFKGTGVTDGFYKSLAANIKRQAEEKPLSKFVLERVEVDITDAVSANGYTALNGSLKNQVKDG